MAGLFVIALFSGLIWQYKFRAVDQQQGKWVTRSRDTHDNRCYAAMLGGMVLFLFRSLVLHVNLSDIMMCRRVSFRVRVGDTIQ